MRGDGFSVTPNQKLGLSLVFPETSPSNARPLKLEPVMSQKHVKPKIRKSKYAYAINNRRLHNAKHGWHQHHLVALDPLLNPLGPSTTLADPLLLSLPTVVLVLVLVLCF